MPSNRPDRLEAFLHQRAAIAQHLAWLDGEISALKLERPELAAAKTLAAEPPASLEPPAGSAVIADNASAQLPDRAAEGDAANLAKNLALANERAEAILNEYASTSRFDPAATRKGCFLFVAVVFALGVAGLLVIYALKYR